MPERRRAGRITGTVRFRVTALAMLVLLCVLAVTGVALVVTQRRALTDQLEETIGHGADNVEAMLVAGEVSPVLTGFGDDDAVAQVVDARGAVVAATPNLAGRPPVAAPPGQGNEVLRIVEDLPHDPIELRVLSRSVRTADGLQVIHVGAPTDDIEESTRVLTTSLTVTAPAVAALLGALVWLLVGRTLRPVEAIRAEVAGMGGGDDLHRRVPEPGTHDEIDRLARTMNAMLDRMEGAAQRQRRFVADASHELRSPLTRMRTELEVDLTHPGSSDWRATHRSVLEETAGLQRLVDDLLLLARSDAGPGATTTAQEVDLDDIVLAAVRRPRPTDHVTVDTSGVAAARVRGDRGQLARAVGNLVDNAARHAGTAVTVSVGEVAGKAVIGVADDGPGIPPDQHERVFERFTRLDDARTNGTGGAGLGLAIAREVVERHGGTLTIDPDHRPGARFVVTLPVDPREAPDGC